MKKIIFILIAIAALIAGCKKYKDGPLISLRSAKGRFFAGVKTLTKYTVNGVDSLSRYQDSLSTNFNFWINDKGIYTCDMSGRTKDGWESTLMWYWTLENKNKSFKVTLSWGNSPGWSTGPFGVNRCPEWQILKLKTRDIIMTTTFNGKEYLIELTR